MAVMLTKERKNKRRKERERKANRKREKIRTKENGKERKRGHREWVEDEDRERETQRRESRITGWKLPHNVLLDIVFICIHHHVRSFTMAGQVIGQMR
jgi:Flp pilus assembly protein TadB